MGGWDLFPPLENASGTHDCSCEKGHFLNQLRSKVNLFQFFGDSGILKKEKKDTFIVAVHKGMGEWKEEKEMFFQQPMSSQAAPW